MEMVAVMMGLFMDERKVNCVEWGCGCGLEGMPLVGEVGLEGKKQKNFKKSKHYFGDHLDQFMSEHSRNPHSPTVEC